MVHRPLESCPKPIRIRSDIDLQFEYCGKYNLEFVSFWVKVKCEDNNAVLL